MTRTFSRIQKTLYPDSVVFLGDLFDGGREWSTRTTQSPEERYRKYGNSFWLREYDRFGRIFFGHWRDGGSLPRRGQPGRKILSHLPGNHDLGFGKGIQASVRKRYIAYFGDGNRMDIIGNHTFVSLDSVSLSAKGQENPEPVEELWRPATTFLDGAKEQRQRLAQEELRVMRGLKRTLPFSHDVMESSKLGAELPRFTDVVTEFPTILLSHVPLYRSQGTPCGPLREHWPPTPWTKDQTEPWENDDRNAIAVRGGYQYQNVLHKEITKEVAEKVGDIEYAFSGDDHDYCEVVHRGYASAGGGIKEITVKSISWAMGVRKPGVVMVSMWNPVDEKGNPLEKDAYDSTLQTHLCLLPDQLSIFIRYGMLFGFTVFALAIRAVLIASRGPQPSLTEAPLLPVSENTSSAENEKATLSSQQADNARDSTGSHSSNSSLASAGGNLQVRSMNSRTRSVSPNAGYALPKMQPGQPLIQYAGYYGAPEDTEKKVKTWGNVDTKKTKKKPKKTGIALWWQEMRDSILWVGAIVFSWYFWLLWNG
jgi:hypothetical protein